MKYLVVAGLCLVLASGAGLAQGKRSQTAEPDHSDAPACDTVPGPGESLICRCETGSTSGSVWGSGPYTADSSVCTAARHSGVIGAEGGVLQLVGGPGEETYDGSVANGVTTSSWGSYGQSFDVLPVGATVATAPVSDFSDAPVCDAAPAEGAVLVCRCERGMATGSVWGSGPYTADSSICAAAVHSGIVGADGGAIALVGLPGQAGYEGTRANGVTTSSWGSYGQSFDVRMASAAATLEPSGPVCDVMPGDADRYSCECTGLIGGAVWGSGPYTADSNICTAARHAGVVGMDGGAVTVIRLPGLENYAGSEANGEETASWDGYDASIVFDRN